MNDKQRESVAKYLYDLSKGFLLAGVIGIFSNKLSAWGFGAHIFFSAFIFDVALYLERDPE
jgi:hypothetical protein